MWWCFLFVSFSYINIFTTIFTTYFRWEIEDKKPTVHTIYVVVVVGYARTIASLSWVTWEPEGKNLEKEREMVRKPGLNLLHFQRLLSSSSSSVMLPYCFDLDFFCFPAYVYFIPVDF